jgi:hypothetical protein
MANATLPPQTPTTTHTLSPAAGVLSYLVPGLGQIAQGRVGKGLLFLVCIYTLFFYGLYLGSGSVTLDGQTYRVSSNVYLPDTASDDPRDKQMPPLARDLYNRPQFAGQFWVGVAAWPAIVQYMYYNRKDPNEKLPLLGDFMREPSGAAINVLNNAGDKRLELAWVYTVIAGVLNILVIYDAVAGPAFGLAGKESDKKE